jgi:three-Cys-motif partner protein
MKNAAAGWSEYTESKQAMLRAFLVSHMSCVKNMPRDRRWCYPRYVYIDLTAGPGIDRVGAPGGAVLVKEVAEQLEMPVDRWLFEKDAPTLQSLGRHVGGDMHTRLIGGDFQQRYGMVVEHYRQLRQDAYGLIYFDPNGATLPVAVLNALAAGHLGRLDILLHVAGTSAYKRLEWWHGRRISADLPAINKTDWRISRIQTQHQFAFLIGTRYARLAKNLNLGFVPIDSDEGRQRWERLSTTEAERQAERQPLLPFMMATNPIEPMPTTFGTRASGLCAPWSSSGRAVGVNAVDSGRPVRRII